MDTCNICRHMQNVIRFGSGRSRNTIDNRVGCAPLASGSARSFASLVDLKSQKSHGVKSQTSQITGVKSQAKQKTNICQKNDKYIFGKIPRTYICPEKTTNMCVLLGGIARNDMFIVCRYKYVFATTISR